MSENWQEKEGWESEGPCPRDRLQVRRCAMSYLYCVKCERVLMDETTWEWFRKQNPDTIVSCSDCKNIGEVRDGNH